MNEPNRRPSIEVTLLVPGMKGRELVRQVTASLVDVPGVELVRADGPTGVVVVQGDVSDDRLLATLNDLGLPASRSEVTRASPRRQS